MLRILLADDHPVVRQGLRTLLEREGFEIIAEATTGQEAAQAASRFHPDVAVLDLAMPVMNGLDAALQIMRENSSTRTILLTMHSEDHYVLQALRSGIRGYVLKAQAAPDLFQAIREVTRGAVYLSPGVSRTVVDAYLNKGEYNPDPLTPRERQVLQLIAEGKTNKESAGILGITAKTAESHRTRIMKKLDIHQTAGLVRYAIRRGLVTT
jgi:two-component system, NarL family, response regulator NreC